MKAVYNVVFAVHLCQGRALVRIVSCTVELTTRSKYNYTHIYILYSVPYAANRYLNTRLRSDQMFASTPHITHCFYSVILNKYFRN